MFLRLHPEVIDRQFGMGTFEATQTAKMGRRTLPKFTMFRTDYAYFIVSSAILNLRIIEFITVNQF